MEQQPGVRPGKPCHLLLRDLGKSLYPSGYLAQPQDKDKKPSLPSHPTTPCQGIPCTPSLLR